MTRLPVLYLRLVPEPPDRYDDPDLTVPLCPDCGGTLWEGVAGWVYCERCG